MRASRAIEQALGHFAADRLAQAEQLCIEALRGDPDDAAALNLLGVIAMRRADPAAAMLRFEHAVRAQPGEPAYLSNLANLYLDLGRSAEAEREFLRLARLQPDSAAVHRALGSLQRTAARWEDAERSFRRVLDLEPGAADARTDLGNVLIELGRIEEAERCYREAARASPRFAPVHNNLGLLLKQTGRVDEAEDCFRLALQIDPGYLEARSNLIFALDLSERHGIEAQQAARREWYERHARGCAETAPAHANVPDPARRLRVGYVSADFRAHSAFCVIAPVMTNHDAAAVEVCAYSGTAREDDLTARIRAASLLWRNTLGLSDAEVAAQIRADRVDILVDLSGHSGGNRLGVFARKPAPVQVTAWGHATGTGLPAIDYFFADPVMIPPEQRGHFAERIFDLPCALVYEPPAYLPEVAPPPALERGAITFGCVNRLEKITDRMLRLWGRILAAAPGARLLVKARGLEQPAVRRIFTERLRAAAVAPDRVGLAGGSDHAGHLGFYGRIDVGLDPFPQGGGVSTGESLWMGVPVLALLGRTPVSRVSPAILASVGLDDWIAQDESDYERIALQAARDPGGLAPLRAGMRERLARTEFGDPVRYCRAVERAYRSIWQEWCARATRA